MTPTADQSAESKRAGVSANRRILVIDDTDGIHADFQKILGEPNEAERSLAALKAGVLATADGNRPARLGYKLDHARQGQEGVELVRDSAACGEPCALAFVDMRMPPGWDGLTTIENIWAIDPDVQVVICTAYSDHSWADVQERLGHTDQLLILRKPFDTAEVCQLAASLTKKWNLAREASIKREQLETLVAEQTSELARANSMLSRMNLDLESTLQEKIRAEAQLRHDAFHDKLTGLPNRSLLKERLERCIERAKRLPAFHFAVLFIDLDNFKVVNDSLGHNAGDELLVRTSQRIANSLRTLDTASRPGDDTASRLGGDEFVVLLDGIRDSSSACHVAARMLEDVTRPIEIAGRGVSVSASIGIATSDMDYEQPDEILRDADAAMYVAKTSGKNRWSLFNTSMHEEALAKLTIQHDLRRATDRGEMKLQYQPIVSLESGRIVALEALLRWNHPGYGPVPPLDFIPVAEESGSIVPIGAWAMETAGQQLRAWLQRCSCAPMLSMSINASAKQFADSRFISHLLEVQRSLGDRGCLNVELTESAMMEHGPSINAVFRRMKEHGIQIHMDDFGTGYSSLSHLDKIEFDALKIDRSFVMRMQDERKTAASVQAIVQLAHLRGLRVIAEGVETYDTLIQLQSLDCDLAQGYFFSKPLDADAAHKLLCSEPRWVRTAA